jgi:hypothetical protein
VILLIEALASLAIGSAKLDWCLESFKILIQIIDFVS